MVALKRCDEMADSEDSTDKSTLINTMVWR